ncbi:MAG: hypothetical protein ACYTHJ_16970 [Planctomycetota bacterium]|jgi:hypothetical protein
MESQDFMREQYRSLRREIKETKSRVFKVIYLGALFMPGLTFLAEVPGARMVGLLVPFVVMMFTILFIANEQNLMRCGRFIRERLEPQFDDCPGWETWLETQPNLRVLDRCLVSCFVITFFVFYGVSAALAIETLWTTVDVQIAPEYMAIAGGTVYGVGALWMLFTILHHWRSATSTA